MRSALTVLLVLSCAGCGSTSHDVSLRDRLASLDATGSFPVAVATHDRRVEVVNGEEAANYIGKASSLSGTVTTESGFPLADDVTHAICESLKLKGYACTEVGTGADDDPKDVLTRLLAERGERTVLLVIRRWKSETKLLVKGGTTLTFDLLVRVYGKGGEQLAESSTASQRKLGGISHSPYEAIAKETPVVFQAELERLFNDPAVIKALTSQPKPGEGGVDEPFPDD